MDLPPTLVRLLGNSPGLVNLVGEKPSGVKLSPDRTRRVDQAEELARAEGQGADVLCDYLRGALLQLLSADGVDTPASGAMIALTAHSDGFAELRRSPVVLPTNWSGRTATFQLGTTG